MILRGKVELMTGDDPGLGGLHGFADADFWDSFGKNNELYENVKGVIKGILIGLDTLRKKIGSLE